MKIARIFPTRTSMCPTDSDAYFNVPDLFTPKDYDEAHISVTFTWDKAYAEWLKKQWEGHAKKVIVGGPAYGDRGEGFTPGMYLKRGIVITSRGCTHKCSYCLVPKREGKLRELPITQGNIIQDNNFLACSKEHQEKVFEMLKNQKQIEFRGGLESRLITQPLAEKLRGLSIYTLWLACDYPEALRYSGICGYF